MLGSALDPDAQGIRTRVELFAHDAGDLGDVFARIDAPVALVTDPPYDDPQALATFLGQAAQADGQALLLAYRPGVDLLPLLKQHFEAHALNGTRGRSLYCCLPKP